MFSFSQGLKFPSMQMTRIVNAPGQLYVFDFNSPEQGAKVVPCNSFPDYGTTEFGPHGLSILQHDGKLLQ